MKRKFIVRVRKECYRDIEVTLDDSDYKTHYELSGIEDDARVVAFKNCREKLTQTWTHLCPTANEVTEITKNKA